MYLTIQIRQVKSPLFVNAHTLMTPSFLFRVLCYQLVRTYQYAILFTSSLFSSSNATVSVIAEVLPNISNGLTFLPEILCVPDLTIDMDLLINLLAPTSPTYSPACEYYPHHPYRC